MESFAVLQKSEEKPRAGAKLRRHKWELVDSFMEYIGDKLYYHEDRKCKHCGTKVRVLRRDVDKLPVRGCPNGPVF